MTMKRIRWHRYMGTLPPGSKSVMRPSRWGNPFKVGEHGTRPEVVQLFREWLTRDDRAELVEKGREVLTGYDLACSCPLDEPCHGDVWIEVLT